MVNPTIVPQSYTGAVELTAPLSKSDVATAIEIRLSRAKHALMTCESSHLLRSAVQSPDGVPADLEKKVEAGADIATSLTQNLFTG